MASAHRWHLIAGGAAALLALASPEAFSAPAFTSKACPAPFVKARARCGTVTVPENYAAPNGRRIGLNVIVFEARKPSKPKAAQFDLEGGPGFAMTDSAVFYAGEGAPYRETRDVVLVDMRGTGASKPLRCEGIAAYERAKPLGMMYPTALVRECAEQLSKSADVRQYSTANASRDIESVRQALGYAQVDLNAVSYGTTLALRYITDYPSRVRTAVLAGSVPASKTPPRYHALVAERGIDLLFKACAADADCAKRYPTLPADLEQALAKLDPELRPIFLEKVRTQLYHPATSRGVPAFIHQTAEGDLTLLNAPTPQVRRFSDGVYLSITCAESFARSEVDEWIADAKMSHFGSYRIVRQREACGEWPEAPADPKLLSTGRSQLPVLFISGALDPVTPPEWTVELMASFPNGKHLIIPEGAHSVEGLSGVESCLDRITLEFVAAKSLEGIDTACVAGMRAGPYR
ncbi:Tripeptidyl aminopeptidase [Usitatibacter rugosus]|uniref:Tripeptidyl aminopeptidase n=1 Tax=Usitatibacter rugosus TaxID=2732067 RepID=A0A6M4GSE5_9PROT|nr:alpha/beta hydrolase [Usitatibacter rugosus]QJR10016.1 Tripeptidyl aminopeptidase [Usitatibacter rugosus]